MGIGFCVFTKTMWKLERDFWYRVTDTHIKGHNTKLIILRIFNVFFFDWIEITKIGHSKGNVWSKTDLKKQKANLKQTKNKKSDLSSCEQNVFLDWLLC